MDGFSVHEMSEMYPQLQAFGKAELIHSVFFQGAPTPSPWLQVQLPAGEFQKNVQWLHKNFIQRSCFPLG